MSQLLYKTRGDSPQKGKPKIYFCCHPEDFEPFFPEISDELLQRQNCSIWYREDPNAPHEDLFFSDLEQMQLFVLPVTRKLLSTENPALDTEFPFAVIRNIPVLPLMLEPGLADLFNLKCGDLQFLDKHSQDATTLSYDEKITTYLNSVLIGDELVEKIRAAFDAYVFLSYRKRDRKYALELMRLIHQKDFYRDIAIWYDEFLTPGENFNDAIQNALQKSNLFLMVVTPNLVSEPNYITTTEYPLALDSGKPILPAELLPTDRVQLEHFFAELPTCTDARNAQELSTALSAGLKQIALRENGTDPTHLFFIGLAYLGGVDVEVDLEKAVKLITDAANQGLPEAAEKLADMYRQGIGVIRSRENAVNWQEKLIAITREAYAKEPSVDTLNRLFQALSICGKDYADMGRLKMAAEQFEQAQKDILDADPAILTQALVRNLSTAYSSLAQIYITAHNSSYQNLFEELKDLGKAKECYENALKIDLELQKISDSSDIRQHLLRDFCNLARLHLTANQHRDRPGVDRWVNLENAAIYAERAISLSKQLEKELGNLQSRRDLANCYQLLGDLYRAQNREDQAEQAYIKTIALREVLAEETRLPEDRSALTDVYINLGDLWKEIGHCESLHQHKKLVKEYYQKARSYYEKALPLCRLQVQEQDTPGARQTLAHNCLHLATMILALEGTEGAKRYYQEGAGLLVETELRLAATENHKIYTQEEFQAHLEKALEAFQEGKQQLVPVRLRPRLIHIQTGNIIAVTVPSFSIGNDSRIVDYCIDSKAISKRHAKIRIIGHNCTVTDTGSRTGVIVNNNRIPMGIAQPIKAGDRIMLGWDQYIFFL